MISTAASITTWGFFKSKVYSEQVQKQIQSGIAPSEVKVDVIKAKWLTALYDKFSKHHYQWISTSWDCARHSTKDEIDDPFNDDNIIDRKTIIVWLRIVLCVTYE